MVIYNLEIHESVLIEDYMRVRRVHGGWIYTQRIEGEITSCFVPYPEAEENAHSFLKTVEKSLFKIKEVSNSVFNEWKRVNKFLNKKK